MISKASEAATLQKLPIQVWDFAGVQLKTFVHHYLELSECQRAAATQHTRPVQS